MKCPNCMLPVGEDSLFCAHCGASLGGDDNTAAVQTNNEYDIEKTMVIPAVRPEAVGVRETREVKRPASGGKAPVKERPKEAPSGKSNTKTNVLVAATAFLITLVIGLGAALAVVLISSSPDKVQTDPAPKMPAQSINQNKTEEKEEKPQDIPEGESVGTEEKTGISVDTDFDFSRGQTLASSELSYKKLKSTEFGYECDIPSAFKFVSDADGEIRYRAEDKTAYMDIGAFSNADALTCSEVKSMVSRELGGAVEYEESGEDWFIMKTVSGGVVYYFKCYADEYIRYVEFVYPAEYRDVYDIYVSDIEPAFVRTE